MVLGWWCWWTPSCPGARPSWAATSVWCGSPCVRTRRGPAGTKRLCAGTFRRWRSSRRSASLSLNLLPINDGVHKRIGHVRRHHLAHFQRLMRLLLPPRRGRRCLPRSGVAGGPFCARPWTSGRGACWAAPWCRSYRAAYTRRRRGKHEAVAAVTEQGPSRGTSGSA